MNLWILRYSFINHNFHHSTITIKQKIIINQLVTELLWGHFLLKNSYSNEKRQIPRDPAEKGRIPRWIPRLKFRGKSKFRGSARNSAVRGKLGPNNNSCIWLNYIGDSANLNQVCWCGKCSHAVTCHMERHGRITTSTRWFARHGSTSIVQRNVRNKSTKSWFPVGSL